MRFLRPLALLALVLAGLLCQSYIFRFFDWLGPKWGLLLTWLVG
jgi:hypothetical protein